MLSGYTPPAFLFTRTCLWNSYACRLIFQYVACWMFFHSFLLWISLSWSVVNFQGLPCPYLLLAFVLCGLLWKRDPREKEEDVTTEKWKVSEVRKNQFSRRRQRPPKSWCSGRLHFAKLGIIKGTGFIWDRIECNECKMKRFLKMGRCKTLIFDERKAK